MHKCTVLNTLKCTNTHLTYIHKCHTCSDTEFLKQTHPHWILPLIASSQVSKLLLLPFSWPFSSHQGKNYHLSFTWIKTLQNTHRPAMYHTHAQKHIIYVHSFIHNNQWQHQNYPKFWQSTLHGVHYAKTNSSQMLDLWDGYGVGICMVCWFYPALVFYSHPVVYILVT